MIGFFVCLVVTAITVVCAGLTVIFFDGLLFTVERKNEKLRPIFGFGIFPLYVVIVVILIISLSIIGNMTDASNDKIIADTRDMEILEAKEDGWGLNIKYIDKNGVTVDAHYYPVFFDGEASGDNKYHIGLNDKNNLVVYSPAYTSK